MKFDVKLYGGASGDGVTNDTVAIQKTIDDAAKYLQAGGSPGPVYFSPSSKPYLVDTLTFPSVNKGWLTFLFDNVLLGNKVKIGSNNAYIGRGSNFAGLSGTFLPGPTSSWVQRASTQNFVELNGVSEVYFEGINIQEQYSKFPTVYIHDDAGRGCVNVVFQRCVIGGGSAAIRMSPSSPNVPSGFNLSLLNCSLSALKNPTLDLVNTGFVTVRDGYLTSAAISCLNPQGSMGFKFENILSEGLDNCSFLTTSGLGGISDIVVDDVRLADAVGRHYLFKNAGKGAQVYIRRPGAGFQTLIDPSSTPESIDLVAEGNGAKETYEQAASSLEFGQLTGSRGPVILYYGESGHRYNGVALKIKP